MSALRFFRPSALALALALSCPLLLTGCGDDAAVSFVKNMPYPYDKDRTTSKVLDNYRYCTDIEWSSAQDEKGGRTVLFTCSLRHFDRAGEIADAYFQKRLEDAEAALDPESGAYKKFLDRENKLKRVVKADAAGRAKTTIAYKPLSNGKSYSALQRAYGDADMEVRRLKVRIENFQNRLDSLEARENQSATTRTMIKQAKRVLEKSRTALPEAEARLVKTKQALDAAQPEYDAMMQNIEKEMLAEFEKKSEERRKAYLARAEKSVAKAKEDVKAPRPWAEIERSQFRFAFAMQGEDKARPQSASIRITYKDSKTAEIPMGDMSLRGILSDDPIGIGTPDKGDILLSTRALFEYYGLAQTAGSKTKI